MPTTFKQREFWKRQYIDEEERVEDVAAAMVWLGDPEQRDEWS